MAYDPAWISCRENMGRDITGDDASGTDRCATAYGNPCVDDRSATDPDVVFYDDGKCIFQSLFSQFRVQWMISRVNMDIGSQKYMVANAYFGAVQKNAVCIGVEVMADMQVIAVVAMEGRNDFDIRFAGTQKIFENLQSGFCRFRR